MKTWMLGFAALIGGCGGVESDDLEIATDSSAVKANEAEVDFANCDEFAGVGLMPAANARAAVPAALTPINPDPTHGIVVVRVAHCLLVDVDGRQEGEGIVAQVGVNLVPPDGTGDINNYTVIYRTNSSKLASALKKLGVEAKHTPQLTYQLTLDSAGTAGTLHIESRQGNDSFEVNGTVTVPNAGYVPFTANWWDDASSTQFVKMSTPIPQIAFGASSMTLTAPAGSTVANLVGATSLTFPFLDSYNRFPAAHMHVAIAP